eukprot:54159-Prorocentrum_minimum.AAC.1
MTRISSSSAARISIISGSNGSDTSQLRYEPFDLKTVDIGWRYFCLFWHIPCSITLPLVKAEPYAGGPRDGGVTYVSRTCPSPRVGTLVALQTCHALVPHPGWGHWLRHKRTRPTWERLSEAPSVGGEADEVARAMKQLGRGGASSKLAPRMEEVEEVEFDDDEDDDCDYEGQECAAPPRLRYTRGTRRECSNHINNTKLVILNGYLIINVSRRVSGP